MMSPLSPLSLSFDHRAYVGAYVIVPSAASYKGLPSPRLRKFFSIAIVAAAAIDYDQK